MTVRHGGCAGPGGLIRGYGSPMAHKDQQSEEKIKAGFQKCRLTWAFFDESG
jgi:hypothetical protein